MEEQYKKTFDQMVDSLKMYQRYELKDKNRKDILDKVYVDPIENDGILNLCLKDNTTVLIGRRGTGKSTIFMRMQNELRKQNDIMTCCLKCGCKNSIQEKRVLSDEERSEIEEIEKKDNLLEREQYQLLKLLQYSRKDKTATELAQELDVSWQKIGWIAKKIEEDYCYLKKEPRKGKMYYVLSDLGREYLDSITP